ncbi:hypothetical protein E4U55_002423 [Claviceps digitariae]|nr:hypothetical protein E4U55_002423 [Claviceps digitariae]
MPSQHQQIAFRLPFIYRLFFLLVEPLSALVAAFYAHCIQTTYLGYLDTQSASDDAPSPLLLPLSTSVALSQLANMYLLFALIEALVLRSTWDMRVWRTVLGVLLVADLGHLYSMRGLGLGVYYDIWAWNAGIWAQIPLVYAGAALRMSFLAGVGFGESRRTKRS